MHTDSSKDITSTGNKPLQLITFTELCSMLRKSRSGIYRLMGTDPAFPKPIKDGGARTCRAFFVAEEVAAWQQARLDARAAN